MHYGCLRVVHYGCPKVVYYTLLGDMRSYWGVSTFTVICVNFTGMTVNFAAKYDGWNLFRAYLCSKVELFGGLFIGQYAIILRFLRSK